MAQDTNLSHNLQQDRASQGAHGVAGVTLRLKQGIRTHILLVIVMALVTTVVTGLCGFLVRHQLRREITENFTEDLSHSVTNFEDMQAERLAALDRENSLLADLPTLKALMTSGDDITIQDGAVEFWDISGDDLFALANSNGRIVAAYTKGQSTTALNQGLKSLLASHGKHYLADGRSLYACSLRPLYFGSDENGTLLGSVIGCTSIERTVRQISQPTGVEAAFVSNGHVVATTFASSMQSSLTAQSLLPGHSRMPPTVKLGNTRFLAASEDLSASATAPLQLVVLKSFEPAEQFISRVDRMILIVGVFALVSGTALMVVLARLLTHPLEELAKGVRAFGEGDKKYRVPRNGTQEVRQLSDAFSAMREEIEKANQALFEAERLATIGRMASSVSHDFRHYLAAIYANAEFLASGRLSSKESADIFSEIRAAVLGTTDMIESLLIFSRTGASMKRSPELMVTLLERAFAAIRAHPDAAGVTFEKHCGNPADTAVVADGKQIERAIFNLLLNACQALRDSGEAPHVDVTLEARNESILVRVVDNGIGVPVSIRESLFEPFVSEGKQKGTGLGLTLAHCIAEEHGGEVVLISSRPGETIFQLEVTRGLLRVKQAAESKRHDQAKVT